MRDGRQGWRDENRSWEGSENAESGAEMERRKDRRRGLGTKIGGKEGRMKG